MPNVVRVLSPIPNKAWTCVGRWTALEEEQVKRYCARRSEATKRTLPPPPVALRSYAITRSKNKDIPTTFKSMNKAFKHSFFFLLFFLGSW